MSEYVVLFARHRYNEDGDGVTAVGQIMRDSDVPPHRVLGLLDYVTVQMTSYITND